MNEALLSIITSQDISLFLLEMNLNAKGWGFQIQFNSFIKKTTN